LFKNAFFLRRIIRRRKVRKKIRGQKVLGAFQHFDNAAEAVMPEPQARHARFNLHRDGQRNFAGIRVFQPGSRLNRLNEQYEVMFQANRRILFAHDA
jgi:hypothetical protein